LSLGLVARQPFGGLDGALRGVDGLLSLRSHGLFSSISLRATASAARYFGASSCAGAGDDQRRARLVDQDAVDLVDDREIQRPLHLRSARSFMLSRR
jgi:hypothetical protein